MQQTVRMGWHQSGLWTSGRVGMPYDPGPDLHYMYCRSSPTQTLKPLWTKLLARQVPDWHPHIGPSLPILNNLKMSGIMSLLPPVFL